MARKKRQEEHINHERWLISYADFITLLFAFFVVMYSVSSVNEGKYRVLSDSLSAAFSDPKRSMEPIQVGQVSREGLSSISTIGDGQGSGLLSLPQIPNLDKNQTEADHQKGKEALNDISSLIEGTLSDFIENGDIEITRNDLWIEIDIKSSLLFPSAMATLQPAAVKILKSLSSILKSYQNPIHVEGFTDSIPIKTIIFPSNWELSASRAASVVQLLTQTGVNPSRMAAIGYGPYRPIASNDTAIGRSKNRRIVLVVLADERVQRILTEQLRTKL
ncbi:MAG: flagellar motor protein MotD [Gammaproteobacteria bacterium]|nr:flagellar motor protein MotD [Gammaproteobacteria bacterium]